VTQLVEVCDTSRKVAGSIYDGFTEDFRSYIILPALLYLVSNQPPTEMSTRNITWGVKAARALG